MVPMAVTLSWRMTLDFSRYSAVVDVLDHHHADEILVLVVMVEGELDELAQRLERRQAVDVELGLALAHLAIGVLEDA